MAKYIGERCTRLLYVAVVGWRQRLTLAPRAMTVAEAALFASCCQAFDAVPADQG